MSLYHAKFTNCVVSQHYWCFSETWHVWLFSVLNCKLPLLCLHKYIFIKVVSLVCSLIGLGDKFFFSKICILYSLITTICAESNLWMLWLVRQGSICRLKTGLINIIVEQICNKIRNIFISSQIEPSSNIRILDLGALIFFFTVLANVTMLIITYYIF